MATTTGTNNLYDWVKEHLMDGTIDLDNDTFKVALCTSTYTPDQANHNFFDDITNEVTDNGYTAGGETLTSVQWVTSGGANRQMKFDAANPVWTAGVGGITAHYWVLYKSTGVASTSPLIAYGLLDDTAGGTDVVTTEGNTLTLNVNANGFFTVG